MKISRLLTTLLACSVITTGLYAADASPSKKSSSRVSPHALALLKRMSNTLAGAQAFTCRTKGILEVPAATGQFITFFAKGDLALKRPNKLAMDVRGDGPHFDFYYDGDSVSAYAPGTGLYSTLKAPPTIDAMLPGLQAETGIRFPTAPLLFSDPYAVLTRGLYSAVWVGRATVGGVVCDHLALRSRGVDWEIWIEAGGRSLPRRLATTFVDRPTLPRVIVSFYDWNLHPWFLGDGRFVFHKPAHAKEIPFASVMKSSRR